jgi:hypothetical protein
LVQKLAAKGAGASPALGQGSLGQEGDKAHGGDSDQKLSKL